MKKTWRTINETLGRHKKEIKLPTTICYNNKNITNQVDISNAFNEYFSNVGTNLASTINATDNATYRQYLLNQSHSCCKFRATTEDTILRIINKMDNKCSSRHDEI